MPKVAVLVDGGFFKKRMRHIYGDLSPDELANKMLEQCHAHVRKHSAKNNRRELYRIFYYDCQPLTKKVTHPLTGKTIDYSKEQSTLNALAFLDILREKRKVALRLGKLSGSGSDYILPAYNVKKLCSGSLTNENLKPRHLKLEVRQKGVDMRIGLDIASLAYKHQVDQIVLIAGDSDFVPAAKLARREGIDFILDPMWNHVSQDLMEHIDGLFSTCDKPPELKKQDVESEIENTASPT